ncbi:MAG: Shedu immune nuclease family protein [Acidobacteriota bacterium]
MDELRVRSTSKQSAIVTDIELRRTTTTRLVFRPMLVENEKDPTASVKGTFVFQRKGGSELWQDSLAVPLSSLKKDEGYNLALNSAETLQLFSELDSLYRIYAKDGIRAGQNDFIRANGAFKSLAELSEPQLQAFLAANATAGADLITRLLAWATKSTDVPALVRLLEKLGPKALVKLNTAVNLSALQECLDGWLKHEKDGSEQFWQEFLTARSFVLEQMFSWPCTIVSERAYVGGKTVQDTGGHIVDFLVKNYLTANAALVEIKTPTTPLTGSEYRGGIRNVSRDLAGSIVQVISYKASLAETHLTLHQSLGDFEMFDPPCALIIGDSRTLTTTAQKRTFELFRKQLSGRVDIITFDELFCRIERLITLLNAQSAAGSRA